MKGIDVSHHQGIIDWRKVAKTENEFAIIKCSQGVNFVSSAFETNKRECRANGMLAGFYHFANGDYPRLEAKFFVESVGDLQEGEILVLDWEIEHADPAGWCLEFLDEVKRMVGFMPVLYTNEFRVKSVDWSKIVAGDYGLWVAKYGLNNGNMNTEPTSGQWPFWAIWQYTSRGSVDGINGFVDMNHTEMDLDTLKKYGAPAQDCPPTPECPPEQDMKNWKTLLDLVGKFLGRDYGDKPNDNELGEIADLFDEIDEDIKVYEVALKEIDEISKNALS